MFLSEDEIIDKISIGIKQKDPKLFIEGMRDLIMSFFPDVDPNKNNHLSSYFSANRCKAALEFDYGRMSPEQLMSHFCKHIFDGFENPQDKSIVWGFFDGSNSCRFYFNPKKKVLMYGTPYRQDIDKMERFQKIYGEKIKLKI